MLGLDSPQKLDIVQVQAQEAPDSYDRITEAIMRLKHRGNGQQSSDGNGDCSD
jgi:glutamate synthase domain-containing protein 1